MEWYKSLLPKQKVNVRECFLLATGMQLNDALKFFSFSECMDILHDKLVIEGFAV